MNGNERQSPRQPPWSQGQDNESMSFGTWLRRQRELREISLREIADVTKISMRYLEALEQDRFDVLPAPVFARGFLREYSSYVGLDPDEVVNTYITAQQEQDGEEVPEPSVAKQKPSLEWTSGLLLLLLVVALLALVAFLAFYAERTRGEEAGPPPPIAAPPVVTPPPPPVETRSDTPLAPLVVTMDFTEDCWVEAMVDGDRRPSLLQVQGESMRIEATQAVHLTLGNPNGVRVEVNGLPYPVEPVPGRAVSNVEIDLASLPEEFLAATAAEGAGEPDASVGGASESPSAPAEPVGAVDDGLQPEIREPQEGGPDRVVQ